MGGTVTFSIIGAYCEEFLNDLISQRIKLRNINNKDGIIYATADISNYRFIAKTSRKYGVQVRITDKKGVYFRIRNISRRPGLVVGVIASAAVVVALRQYVWNIEVHGNSQLSENYILGVLEGYGITAGIIANDADTLGAERMIMLHDDNIKWINIEINGSRADVYLSESKSSDNDEIDFMTPCNIVATRTGVIVDSDISSGNMLYENGSGVAEGSVIVSGAVSSGDSTILVHSEGSVIADFTEEVEFAMDYTTVEKIPTGESFIHKQIMLLGMVFPLDDTTDTANAVCDEQIEQCSLWGIELPVKIKTETYTRYSETTVTRKEEDVRRILEGRLELYQYNFLRDYEILDIEKTFETSETGEVLKAKIKLRGNIAVKKAIYEH